MSDFDEFGTSLAWVGDINGDGIDDLAAGTPSANVGALSAGRVWVLFMQKNASVLGKWPIDNFFGGLQIPLEESDQFGFAVHSLGDFDGDGVPDIAVGAPGDENWGAIHILCLNRNGTVRTQTRIIHPSPGTSRIGESVASLGDLNGDGTTDIAFGGPSDSDGGVGRGCVWIALLNPDGTPLGFQKISSTQGGFVGPLADTEGFGGAVAGLGDLDGDGLSELAVGQWQNSDAGSRRGAVWILFLNPDGTVRTETRIGANQLPLDNDDALGTAVGALGDLDGDGIPDLVAGAPGDDDQPETGALWMVLLHPNGTVKATQKISRTVGGFTGSVGYGWGFGRAVAGNLRHAVGAPMVAVGVQYDPDGGERRGSIWVLSHSCGSASATFRNGSGANPPILASYSRPSLGTTWIPELNCIGHADGAALLLVYAGPASGPTLPAGEVLLNLGAGRILSIAAPHHGGILGFSLAVPNDATLCGLRASVQGVCFGTPGPQLSNAYDIVVGQ